MMREGKGSALRELCYEQIADARVGPTSIAKNVAAELHIVAPVGRQTTPPIRSNDSATSRTA
jgi:hypothetical protein